MGVERGVAIECGMGGAQEGRLGDEDLLDPVVDKFKP